jgi:hypothetical protein
MRNTLFLLKPVRKRLTYIKSGRIKKEKAVLLFFCAKVRQLIDE